MFTNLDLSSLMGLVNHEMCQGSKAGQLYTTQTPYYYTDH